MLGTDGHVRGSPIVGEFRVRADAVGAADSLGVALIELTRVLTGSRPAKWGPREFVVLCIGSDRSTGDSLGPLVGTNLERLLAKESTGNRRAAVRVLGTLDNPVHAANLEANLQGISRGPSPPLTLAVDACLGRADHVGMVTVGLGPLRPGAGVNKILPRAGDLYMTGTVNVGGFMEYLVLQNTRLSVVFNMARVMAQGITLGLTGLLETPVSSSCGD